MKMYSFSGAYNPFYVRQKLYENMDFLQDNIEGEVTDEHLDVLAFALYKENFGLGYKFSNIDIISFFEEVNKSIKTEFSCMREIVRLAACVEDFNEDRNFSLEVDAPRLRLCLSEKNIEVLEDLYAILPNDELIDNCYTIAYNLNSYRESMGELPVDINYFMKNYAAAKKYSKNVSVGENNA